MSDNYIGEIRMFAGNFAPNGWLFCSGQLLPISENDALFTLIGTMYGGDGQETFALPNLQSRVPMHFGTGADGVTYQQGEAAGTEEVTLTIQQIPAHTHPFTGSTSPGTSNNPGSAVVGASPSVNMFSGFEPAASMNASSITPVGGSQPHTNMQPYLVINFIISLFGEFPTQT